MRRVAGHWSAYLVTAILLSGGCGPSAEDVVSVRGKVYYQGEPLAGGMIVFSPDPEHGESGPTASSPISDDGSFNLQSTLGQGLPPGWHRISIAGPPRSPGQRGSAHFPKHYKQPDRSGLCREVKATGDNIFEFNLSGS